MGGYPLVLLYENIAIFVSMQMLKRLIQKESGSDLSLAN